MNTKKYILSLCLMLILPLFASGQIYKSVSKREVEQIGKKTYKVSNGEITTVVNTVGSGLEDEYSKFLFRKSGNAEADSIFSDLNSKYGNLEEAALDIDKLLREVELDRKTNSDTNEALAFWIARRNRERKKKEQEANTIAENVLKQDPSVEDLIRLRYRFGNKPTYYINGVEVEQSIANKLYPGEIVKREIRTQDTASGNPNGEVWYTVTDKALDRIKIPLDLTYNYLFEDAGATTTSQLATYLKEKEDERRRLELKSIPVVRREKTADGGYVDIAVTPETINKQKEEQQVEDVVNYGPGTQVISRSVNNQRINRSSDNTGAPAVSPTPVTPAPRVGGTRSTVTYENNRTVPSQKPASQPTQNNKKEQKKVKKDAASKKEESTQKKSIRKIKEDRQNRYEDDSPEDGIYEEN